MNTERIKRLADMAKQALDDYNAEVARGGEPIYPAWARDLAEVLDDYVQLVAQYNALAARAA